MKFTFSQKKWAYVDGLGKVEVLGNVERPVEVKRCKKTNRTRDAISIKEFMRGERHEPKRLSRKPLIPLMLIPFTPITAFAETSESAAQAVSVQDKMMSAFSPIIDLVQSLAYPVALLVVLGGGLSVIIGNSDKGLQLIQRAGLGYVLVMMLPMLLDVLVDAMNSVV